jgi:hypothetical protein
MNTNEQYLSGPLLWIGISIGVIFAILFYTPFPFSIPLAIIAFVLLNFHFRKKVIKGMNTKLGNLSGYSCINCTPKKAKFIILSHFTNFLCIGRY